MNQQKIIYLQLTLLALAVLSFIYCIISSASSSGEFLRNTQNRLDSISAEIVHSRRLIQDTYSRIDSMHHYLRKIDDRRMESNQRVNTNDQEMKKILMRKNIELITYKNNLEAIIQEREITAQKLDSLVQSIEEN